MPSAFAPMVKWRSHLASTEGFRVRILIGVHIERRKRKGYPRGDGNRSETGRAVDDALRVRIPPLPLNLFLKNLPPMVKRKSRLGPNEAVRVRLPVGACMVFVV